MTVDVEMVREWIRAAADAAAATAKECRARGNTEGAQFAAGRQAGMVTALAMITEGEMQAGRERDEHFGQGVNLSAVARLEAFGEFATETGALDQASGAVFSDAEGGL